jgi:hypothetical protein
MLDLIGYRPQGTCAESSALYSVLTQDPAPYPISPDVRRARGACDPSARFRLRRGAGVASLTRSASSASRVYHTASETTFTSSIINNWQFAQTQFLFMLHMFELLYYFLELYRFYRFFRLRSFIDNISSVRFGVIRVFVHVQPHVRTLNLCPRITRT